ncbi:MAG: 4Fe-4S dicluster domain-containing protein [Coriobacteriales bacterium]|jgi:Fe-S-cluster-containing dehydrogenase component|nr:4Fe-4S dicluster domain-containing protein [Coriobacteriales bacterium]
MTRYAMVMDTRRCIGCDSCSVACKIWNDLPLEIMFNPVITDGPHGEYPYLHMSHVPLICMHCEEAPCTHVCPTGASKKDEDGIIWVDPDACIGCSACIAACPYDARHKDHGSGVVMKCDFCKDRVRKKQEPHCVWTCHQRARIFGDLDDPKSEVSRLVNSLRTEKIFEDLGTDPQVYYLFGMGGQG